MEFSSSCPKNILDNLAKRGYNKVIIGGGSDIYSLFLRNKLVDEIYLTVAPKIFGKGVDLFNEEIVRGASDTKYKILDTRYKILDTRYKILNINYYARRLTVATNQRIN